MKEPTAEEISAARTTSSLSRSDAAAVIHKSVRSWEKWEVGERPMDPAFFELFLIKTGQKQIEIPVAAAAPVEEPPRKSKKRSKKRKSKR